LKLLHACDQWHSSRVFTLLPIDTVNSVQTRKVTAALQYSPTEGLPPLVKLMQGLQLREHTPPSQAAETLSVAMSTGSQESLARCFAMLLNPEDTLLVESPTYSGSYGALPSLAANIPPSNRCSARATHAPGGVTDLRWLVLSFSALCGVINVVTEFVVRCRKVWCSRFQRCVASPM